MQRWLANLLRTRSRKITTARVPAGFVEYRSRLERCEARLALSSIPFLPFEPGILDPDTLEPFEELSSPNWGSSPPFEPLQSVDPTLQALPGMDHSGATLAASQYGLQGRGQTVAIIDSGIAYDHHALGRGYGPNYRVVGGWDFAENDSNPYDDAPGGYHGTHVAGIIGSNAADRLGVVPGVDFVALRVFDDFGKSDIQWTEAALQWVLDHRDTFENPITTVNLSLGASWNSASPPSWASLEEELSALNQAGVVVVVSAGNSFQQHLTPGLAYPAASPFTIPVGSIDADGSLSDFSQRDPRILAAPGRAIESAVPDFFYGKDGVVNDWAKSSGTSMATPFVTGAAVAVREAFESIGHSNITPDLIYSTLRDSANDVYDSATDAYYKVLNIHAAIESVYQRAPSPDTWQPESAAGERSSSASKPLELPSDTSPLVSDDNTLPAQNLPAQNNLPTQNSAGLPNFISLQGDSLVVSGNMNANQFQVDLSEGLRIEMDGEVYKTNSASVQRVVIDGAQNSDSISIVGSSRSEKIEMRVGETVLSHDKLELLIRNIEQVRFEGGGGADRAYLYDADTDDRLESYPNKASLKGLGYDFAVENIERIFVHATLGGDDQAFVYDSAGNDVLSVRPQFASVAGEGYFNYLAGFERVYAYGNFGGVDTATIYDSVGNDLYSSSGEVTSIVGAGFSTFVRGYERVEAYSQAGGIDRAKIYAGEGQSISREPDYVIASGGSRESVAKYFSQVETFRVEASPSSESLGAVLLSTGENPSPIIKAFSAEEQRTSKTDWMKLAEESQVAAAPVWFGGGRGEIADKERTSLLYLTDLPEYPEDTVESLALLKLGRAGLSGNSPLSQIKL